MLLLSLLVFSATSSLDAATEGGERLRGWFLHSGSGDDARNLLSTLVTAIITMSSIVFSITVVTLTLAASQFGSRVVRIYMSDLITKLALGLFTMTVVYCLLALRAVEKDMPVSEVPHVTVTVGLLLGLTCVLALLFFLHRVARSIVADVVIRHVAKDLENNIADLHSLERGPAAACNDSAILPADFSEQHVMLASAKEGYVQSIDYGSLVALARKRGMILQLSFGAGAFISSGGWLGAVYPASSVTAADAAAVQDAVMLGDERTPTQDIEFSVRQLVDVALRALSPAINDPNTALVVVDRLCSALSLLMTKAMPPNVHRDQDGAIRVLSERSGYDHLLDTALNEIRLAASLHPTVIVKLAEALGRVAEHVRLPEQRDALLRQLKIVTAAGLREANEPYDRTGIEQASAVAERKLVNCLTGSQSVMAVPEGHGEAIDAPGSGAVREAGTRRTA